MALTAVVSPPDTILLASYPGLNLNCRFCVPLGTTQSTGGLACEYWSSGHLVLTLKWTTYFYTFYAGGLKN